MTQIGWQVCDYIALPWGKDFYQGGHCPGARISTRGGIAPLCRRPCLRRGCTSFRLIANDERITQNIIQPQVIEINRYAFTLGYGPDYPIGTVGTVGTVHVPAYDAAVHRFD